jgi:hypothetical protein
MRDGKVQCPDRRCDPHNRLIGSADDIGSHTDADVLEISQCAANSNEAGLKKQLGKIGSKFLIKFVGALVERRRQRLPNCYAFANER